MSVAINLCWLCSINQMFVWVLSKARVSWSCKQTAVMSAHHRNVNKLVVVKKLTDISYPIEQVLRAELESNNRGFLTLLGDGRLILTAWINKKVTSKIVEDASEWVILFIGNLKGVYIYWQHHFSVFSL